MSVESVRAESTMIGTWVKRAQLGDDVGAVEVGQAEVEDDDVGLASSAAARSAVRPSAAVRTV